MNYLNNVQKSIDYIEANLTKEIKVSDIENVSGLSTYHFLRIFHASTGDTLGSYLRLRRLTEAASRLLETKDRILDIAIDFQFNSQEAFTRAFKDQFSLTPARYRLNNKKLVMFMKKALCASSINYLLENKDVMEYKIVDMDELKLVGMVTKTTMRDNKIPALWQKFNPSVNTISCGTQDGASYGVCLYNPNFGTTSFSEDSEYEYLAAISVKEFKNVPECMITRVIPAHKYAVFTHKGDLKNLQMTYDYIYGTWVDKSGYTIDHKDDFELYDSRFNPMDWANSEMDIYIPIC